MKPHKINLEDVHGFIIWHTFTSSTSENKKLQIKVGETQFRVLHGQEIVYEGSSECKAVEEYNSITSKPIDQPKLSN